MSSKFGQILAANVLKNNELQNICNSVVNRYYKDKFSTVKQYIAEYFRDDIPYFLHEAEGGMFQWIWFKDLPISDVELFQRSKEHGLFIVPGNPFFKETIDSRHSKECIRLSLTSCDEDIEQGIKILANELNRLYK